MVATVHRIHQNRDEGLSGNVKELKLADIRGEILSHITGVSGEVVRKKAHDLGQSLIPTMAASTIIKFATGQTPTPSTWTIRKMVEVAGQEIWILPKGAKVPPGAIKLE